MKAVILAAGEGSRMWPLAEARPKHLLPIAGEPILGHLLTALAQNNISDVTLVVGFQEDAIRQALTTGKEYGDRIPQHVEAVKTIIRALKLNLIPLKELGQIKREASKLNLRRGKKM